MMMDDNAPIHERRKLELLKPIKKCAPLKRIVVAEVCGETYSKNNKKDGVEKRHKHKN